MAVTTDDVSAMLNKIRGGPHANRVHELVRQLFRFAQTRKWIESDPSAGWTRRDEVKRQAYLDAAAWAKLDAALPVNVVGDALRFALATGARIGETLSFRWVDLKDEGTTWVKPAATVKQKRDHVLPLSSSARVLIERQEKRGPTVFARADGSEVKNCRRTWLWALKRSGLSGIRIHDLRHTRASRLVSSGASLAVTGALLGHSSPATTARYAHLEQTALREAAERADNVVPLRKLA